MSEKIQSKYNFRNIAVFAAAYTACLYYWQHSVLQISISAALIDALFSTFILYIGFLCIKNIPDLKPADKTDILYLLAYTIILALSWFFICKYVLLFLLSYDPNYTNMWEHNSFIRIILSGVIIYCSFIIEYLHSLLKQMQEDVREEKQTEQLRKDAELFKLRQQLQPHFLFNSLNSVNALIVREPKNARKMIQQLSDYLRNNIKKEDDDFIDFKEEMNDLRLYLAIEQVRFGHRLKVEEDVQQECETIKVPPFLFQPLVENAIKYGLYGTTGIVTILISIRKSVNELTFTIRNPYDTDAVMTRGTGFGLESIRRRLYLLFARNDLLKTETGILPNAENENLNIYSATIIIPLKKA